MKQPLKDRLSDIWNSLSRTRPQGDYRGNQPGELQLLLEDVVDGTDSRIRLVSGYKRKLQAGIQDALEYTTGLVDQIPGAIEISRRTFISNPYANAFFANVTDLMSVFCHSSEIRDFMEEKQEDLTGECCALLCMHMSQKTVMGMELAGDMLRRDVQQIAVSFSDHRLYSPAPTEQETRAGLKHCLFQGLTTAALARIMEIRLENHKLAHEVQRQRAMLRHQEKQADNGVPAAAGTAPGTEELRSSLARAEKALLDAGPVTPRTCLEQVVSVFRHPDEFVRMNRFPLKLNKMGIKIEEKSKQPCNDLELTEVVIGNEPARVISLARFPATELHAAPGLPVNGLI